MPASFLTRAARRRDALRAGVALAAGSALAPAWGALGLSDAEVASGLRALLEEGLTTALAQLGQPEGFLLDARTRIGLPGWLPPPARGGPIGTHGESLDDFVFALNRVAEGAMPEARKPLLAAVRALSIDNARPLLDAGGQAATEYLVRQTRTPLREAVLPLVARSAQHLELPARLERLVRSGVAPGAGARDVPARLDQHVSDGLLDAVILLLGDQERRIRSDPGLTGRAVIRRVFGRR